MQPNKRRKLDNVLASMRKTTQADSDDSDAGDQQDSQASYQKLLKIFGPEKRQGSKKQNVSHGLSNSMRSTSGSLPRFFEEGEGGDSDVDESDSEQREGQDDPLDDHFARIDRSTIKSRASATDSARSVQVPGLESLGIVRHQVLKFEDARIEMSNKPLTPFRNIKDMRLKKRLQKGAEEVLAPIDTFQAAVASTLFSYKDVMYAGRTVSNAPALRNLTCLHALNHLFKTRDKILKNTARLSNNPDLELRDQGIARPRILFLLETRQMCVRYVNTIVRLCQPEQEENRKRFTDAFEGPEDAFGDDKPADFRELFEGNDDNDFRIGVKFTRKTIKFFSQFSNSDIIFASPVGLRRTLESRDSEKPTSDLLSSIEICVIDQVDAMAQQNWEHVMHSLKHLNQKPIARFETDITRIRPEFLDFTEESNIDEKGTTKYLLAKYLRQTIAFSAFMGEDIEEIYTKSMQNTFGKLLIQPIQPGILRSIHYPWMQPIQQKFLRFHSKSLSHDDSERSEFFKRSIVPSLYGDGILIFAPNRFDYLRLRGFFRKDDSVSNISCGLLGEDHQMSEVRRARSLFASGRHQVLLYSGRAHHFRRYKIQGVKRVIFYRLPENSLFYKEAVEFIKDSVARGLNEMEASVRVIFSKWDHYALEAVVGAERVGRMIQDESVDTFDFT